MEEARESCRRAVKTTAKALESAESGLGETIRAFIAWAARHDVDVDDAREARLTLRFGSKQSNWEATRALREGFRVWKDDGLPE